MLAARFLFHNMLKPQRNTFKKSERLCSRILIDSLFQGASHSVSAYPIRAIFLPVASDTQTGVSVLISVPKKRFHDAVDRNRVKRQIREAYRKNKHTLIEQATASGKGLLVAFVYVSDKIEQTDYVEKRMIRLLDKMKAEL